MSKHLTFTAIVLVILLVTWSAFAYADTSYPGSMCVAYKGAVVPTELAHVQNNSLTDWAYVVCPTGIRTNTTTLGQSIDAYVIDQSKGAGVCCRAWVRHGNFSACGGWECTSGYASTAKRLDIWHPTAETMYSVPPDTYRYIECKLPPRDVGPSAICSYGGMTP